MKISRLIIPDFQQFKDFDLDLTYPKGHEKAGEPLDKVCLIGGNGTGKSTLIRCIHGFLTDKFQFKEQTKYFRIFKVKIGQKSFYQVSSDSVDLEEDIENSEDFILLKNGQRKSVGHSFISNYASKEKEVDNYFYKELKDNRETILVYCPPESTYNGYLQIENTLNSIGSEPSGISNKKYFNNIVSSETIENLLSKLDSKTLKAISEKWNEILPKANLESIHEVAKHAGNAQVHIRHKNTKEVIDYNQLSTGIRNFIFKIGHIYALYFNRNIESGFLLADEPENSLSPDFLYDLVDTYTGITKNTQIFMATHSPIVAAQFQPYERFILEFEEGAGHVKVRRGTTPVGDDPNDILIKDFGIRSILGREGVKKWERYIELKALIPLEKDPANKNSMIEEFMQIGSDYNFAADAVS